MQKKLRRPLQGRLIAGVCASIANYFGLDPVLLRVVWLILTLFAGGGIILYIILWIVIPDERYA